MNISCKSLMRVTMIAGGLAAAATAQAHYPWLMASDFTPAEGRTANVFLAWGHAFPFEGFMTEDRVGSVEIVSPDGKRSALAASGAGYATPELKEGGYVVLASQKSSFYTRTKQGSKRQSKEGLNDVIRCSYSSNNMKAILTVGGEDDGKIGESFGQPLEIIPLSDPSELQVGDYMDVKITLRNEPYSGMVYATYAGFSTEGAYAYTVEADDGKASIRILHPGQWLVRAKAEQAYPDPKVCDIESYTTTLTFAVR